MEPFCAYEQRQQQNAAASPNGDDGDYCEFYSKETIRYGGGFCCEYAAWEWCGDCDYCGDEDCVSCVLSVSLFVSAFLTYYCFTGLRVRHAEVRREQGRV